ncbi:hypothetical protein J7K18_00810 [bacterium]|nr:hypothetical protein [bacterium]
MARPMRISGFPICVGCSSDWDSKSASTVVTICFGNLESKKKSTSKRMITKRNPIRFVG